MLTFGGAVSYSELKDMPIPEFKRLKDVADRIVKMRGS